MKKESQENIKKNIKMIGTIVFLLAMALYWWNFQAKKTTFPKEPDPPGIEQPKTCDRTEPYPKPVEFERILSLIFQRQQQNKHPYTQKFTRMRNCLDIRYTDLKEKNGAEGVFYFDAQISSPSRLVLEVDSSYAITDDITTAYLLSHELTHARQYVETVSGEKQWSCVDSETEAFYEQLVFGSLLNEEEGRSVISRLETGSQNTQLKQYEQLLDMSWDTLKACEIKTTGSQTPDDISCWKQGVTQRIKQMIVSNPFYQEQCSEEL